MNLLSMRQQTADLGWQLFLTALAENNPQTIESGMQLMARVTPQSVHQIQGD